MIQLKVERLPILKAAGLVIENSWAVYIKTPEGDWKCLTVRDMPEELAVIIAAAPALIEFAFRLSQRPNSPTAIPVKQLLSQLGIELYYPDAAGDPRDIRTRKDT